MEKEEIEKVPIYEGLGTSIKSTQNLGRWCGRCGGLLSRHSGPCSGHPWDRVPPDFVWSEQDGRWKREYAYALSEHHPLWPSFNSGPWRDFTPARRAAEIARIREVQP